jgi:hypothetical protein
MRKLRIRAICTLARIKAKSMIVMLNATAVLSANSFAVMKSN